MPKLVTPVQYEPSLKQLNDIRPLNVADESKTLLDIPVIDSNPVSDNSRAIGKLLRCDNAGAILSYLEKGIYHNIEVFTWTYERYNEDTLITFSQKVFSIVAHLYYTTGAMDIFWSDSTYKLYLQKINLPTIVIIKFSGTKFYSCTPIAGVYRNKMRYYGVY